MDHSNEPHTDVFSLDDDLALFAWELNNLARSKEEADLMYNNRAEYFESLYDDITIPQSRYSDGSDSYHGSPLVEHNVLDILDKKEAYDSRIARLRDKYTRFRVFLMRIDPAASQLFRNYFEHGTRAPDKKLNAALKKYCQHWGEYGTDRGKLLDEEAWDDFLLFRRERSAAGIQDKKRKDLFTFPSKPARVAPSSPEDVEAISF